MHQCLSVFGWMFEYLLRISLEYSNMILARIPCLSDKNLDIVYHPYLLVGHFKQIMCFQHLTVQS